jgi:hypothetical protein
MFTATRWKTATKFPTRFLNFLILSASWNSIRIIGNPDGNTAGVDVGSDSRCAVKHWSKYQLILTQGNSLFRSSSSSTHRNTHVDSLSLSPYLSLSLSLSVCLSICLDPIWDSQSTCKTPCDQQVSVHLTITMQEVTDNVQSVPRQSPDIYWHAELCSRRPCSV